MGVEEGGVYSVVFGGCSGYGCQGYKSSYSNVWARDAVHKYMHRFPTDILIWKSTSTGGVKTYSMDRATRLVSL